MKTKVAFRKIEGDVIALFVDEVSHGGQMIQSYEHYGQHGDASTDSLTEWERAEPHEYRPLLVELRQRGYDVEIVA